MYKRQALGAAGFRDITIEGVERISTAPSARDAAIAYCQGNPMRAEIEGKGAPGLEAATERAAQALTKKFGSGAIQGRIRAVVVTAMR